jgi:hypothetical protein
MASSSPLTGVVLVDCAKANVENGVEVAANQCGYGDDTRAFEEALKSACADMNIDLEEFAELSVGKRVNSREGIEVYPDTPDKL